jgi:hypothetical protein
MPRDLTDPDLRLVDPPHQPVHPQAAGDLRIAAATLVEIPADHRLSGVLSWCCPLLARMLTRMADRIDRAQRGGTT